MSEQKIQMMEKENPQREKKEYSTLTIKITCDDPEVIISEQAKQGASLKFPKPLVRKIEGPFTKDNKLVEEMIAGDEYVFKVTKHDESIHSLIKHIWWAEQLDDKEIVDLEYKKGENPYLDDKKLVCFKYKAKKAEKIRIYAYVASPAEKVSIEVSVLSFPFLIARSVKRAGVCYGTNGDELTREDITNLNIQYPQQKDLLKQKLEKGYEDLGIKYDKNKSKEVAKYEETKASIIKDALEYIEKYDKLSDGELLATMKDDMDDWARGDLDDNLINMIEFFKNNSNTANKYEDKRLTGAIANHERTKEFIEGFASLLERDFNKNAYSLNTLKVKDKESELVKNEYNKKDGGSPNILGVIGLQELKSLRYEDHFSGLGISVDGTQAYNIFLTEFSISDGVYKGQFKLEIFDHFGLDSADILKDKLYIRHQEEFICWYILQHLRGYKPFITYIPLHYTFEGALNKNNLKVKLNEDF